VNFTYTDENGVTQTIELPPQMVREIEQLAEQIQVRLARHSAGHREWQLPRGGPGRWRQAHR